MLIATAALSITSSHSFAGVDEYGASGTIPGVQFTGGDGSYERAVKDGITIAICSDFPFNYQDEKTKQPAGMDVEILKEVARRLGITNLKWELMPIDSVIPALVSKRVDLIGDNLHENPKRLEVVSFTSPAYFYGGAFATQKGNPPGISDWASLAGKNVGVYRGSIYQSMLEGRKDLGSLQLYTTSDAVMADLSAGRVDAILDDDMKILAYIAKNPALSIELSNLAIPADVQLGYARYVVRKGDVDLNWAVSRAIDEMRADGTIAKMLPMVGLPTRNLFNFPLK